MDVVDGVPGVHPGKNRHERSYGRRKAEQGGKDGESVFHRSGPISRPPSIRYRFGPLASLS